MKKQAKVSKEQAAIAQQNGIHLATVYTRLHYGWNMEQAITTPPGANRSEYNKNSIRSNSWHSPGIGILLRCPIPGCAHTGNIITKVHCRNEHGMERDEVGEKYGMPFKIDLDMQKRFENLKEGSK